MEEDDVKVCSLTHPQYDAMLSDWQNWRLTFEGGDAFVAKFLIKFSSRESDGDFTDRKRMTYLPAHAKGAINTVRNGIFQRLVDVVRAEGPETYQLAVIGQAKGVDLCGNSMNAFVGKFLLPELLVQGKVGIYVDNRRFRPDSLLNDAISSPYIYYYRAEDIRNWNYNSSNVLTAVLLRDRFFAHDSDFGLPTGQSERYRLLNLLPNNKVSVRFFDDEGCAIDAFTGAAVAEDVAIILDLPAIPFEIAELTDSLMKDIYKYQVALLNSASSDVSYIMKSNFPFYVEQYEPRYNNHLRGPGQGDGTGTSTEGTVGKKEIISAGPTSGRRYPMGADKPAFINPSSEPLVASMSKQTQMKEEIRQLTDLSLSNIHVKSASAESKKEDKEGLQAGLSAIGIVLETAETRVAEHWANYVNDTPAIVKYPESYSLKTDAQRLDQANDKKALKDAVPSITFQRVMSKEIANSLFEGSVAKPVLADVHKEIDEATMVHSTIEDVLAIHKEGLVSDEDAAKAMGIPTESVQQAQRDHAERIARIQAAQSANNSGARGDSNTDVNREAAENEKLLKEKQNGV